MPLGEMIDRQTDAERHAGLRGWTLVPLVVIALGMAALAFSTLELLFRSGVSSDQRVGASVIYVVLIGFGAVCLWLGVKERKLARPVIIGFFSVALLSNVAMLLSSGTDPLRPSLGIMIDVAMIVFMAFSQRAKLTFTR